MLQGPLGVLTPDPTTRPGQLLTRVLTRRSWNITFYSLITASVFVWILTAALDYQFSPAAGLPLAGLVVCLLIAAAWDAQIHPPAPITAASRRWFFRLISLLVALQLGDIISTTLALARGAAEGNPAAAALFSAFGQPLTYAAKIIMVIVASLLFYRYLNHPWVRVALGLVLLFSFIVVANNLIWLFGWGSVLLAS